jgi:hypothetical protein
MPFFQGQKPLESAGPNAKITEKSTNFRQKTGKIPLEISQLRRLRKKFRKKPQNGLTCGVAGY